MKHHSICASIIALAILIAAPGHAQDVTGATVQQMRQIYAKNGGTDPWVNDPCLPQMATAVGGFSSANRADFTKNFLTTLSTCKCLSDGVRDGYATREIASEFVYEGANPTAPHKLPTLKLPQGVTPQVFGNKLSTCIMTEMKLMQSGAM